MLAIIETAVVKGEIFFFCCTKLRDEIAPQERSIKWAEMRNGKVGERSVGLLMLCDGIYSMKETGWLSAGE